MLGGGAAEEGLWYRGRDFQRFKAELLDELRGAAGDRGDSGALTDEYWAMRRRLLDPETLENTRLNAVAAAAAEAPRPPPRCGHRRTVSFEVEQQARAVMTAAQ